MRIIIIIRPFQRISTVHFRCICWLRTINTKQSNNTEYGNYFYPTTFFQANHPFFSNHVHIWDRKCCMGLLSVSVIYLNFPISVYHSCRNLSTINDQIFSTKMKYLFIKYIRKLIDLDIKSQLFRILSENSDQLFPESAAIVFPVSQKKRSRARPNFVFGLKSIRMIRPLRLRTKTAQHAQWRGTGIAQHKRRVRCRNKE